MTATAQLPHATAWSLRDRTVCLRCFRRLLRQRGRDPRCESRPAWASIAASVSTACALAAIAPAIALTGFAALFFINASTPQPLAVRGASAALRAIAPAIALTGLAALFFVNAGTAQAFAIASAILHVLYDRFRRAASMTAGRCGRRTRDARKTPAGRQDHYADHCLHAGSLLGAG